MKRKSLTKKSKKKAKDFRKLRQDPRFLKTLGKLKKAGFLDVQGILPTSGMVFLEDALWAARIEPRIYELLPAILVNQPKFFAFSKLPDDLKKIVTELKTGKPKTYYRGVAPKAYERWIPVFARNGEYPSVMKSFRLHREDIKNLEDLQSITGLSKSEILREAIRRMASELSMNSVNNK